MKARKIREPRGSTPQGFIVRKMIPEKVRFMPADG